MLFGRGGLPRARGAAGEGEVGLEGVNAGNNRGRGRALPRVPAQGCACALVVKRAGFCRVGGRGRRRSFLGG
eukprot:4833548-Pyramimonas_sp.AAC.1